MKKKLFGMMAILGLLALSPKLMAQCGGDDFLDDCASSLGTHTFIKAFNVETKSRKQEKVEYSYVFSKGSDYLIIVCDRKVEGKRMIVNLYDRNHQLIASSYSKKTRKHYPDLVYPCQATGVYYMETTFEGLAESCGVIILGFNKQ